MYKLVIYFIGGTTFTATIQNEETVEEFKKKVSNRKLLKNTFCACTTCTPFKSADKMGIFAWSKVCKMCILCKMNTVKI